MKSIIEQIGLTGFLADYISFASSLTDAPLEFHLGAGLTALSTVCGSRIVYPGYGGRRQWANLYTLLIAPSGLYRKSTSVGIAEDLLKSVNEDIVLIGEQSREKFLSLLKANPNVLYPISEFAAILSMWNRDYSQGFREIVVDLFDCRQKYIRQTVTGEGKIVIEKPALNILAASTLDWLKEKLTEGDLRGGLMGRFLIIPGGSKTEDPGLRVGSDGKKRGELVRFLTGVHNIDSAWVDITGVLDDYNLWVREAEHEMEKEYNPEILGFQSRLASHVLKLAVLLCVSGEPEPQKKYVLAGTDLNKAEILGKWLIMQAVELATTGFIKSKTEANVQKLLRYSSRNGGIKRSEVLKQMHLNSRELDAIVLTAAERGEITIEREVGKTKPLTYYIAVQKDDKVI